MGLVPLGVHMERRDTDVTVAGGTGTVVTEGSEGEPLESLEAVERYLREAENALWTAAAERAGDERHEELEELTQGLWELQHELDDLQRELDE